MVLTYQSECVHTIVPVLTQVHLAFQESNIPGNNTVMKEYEVLCGNFYDNMIYDAVWEFP